MKKILTLLTIAILFSNCSNDDDNDLQNNNVIINNDDVQIENTNSLSSITIPFDTARRLFGQLTFEESNGSNIENISIVIADDLNRLEETIDVNLNYNNRGILESFTAIFTDANDELIGNFNTTFTNDGENLITASSESPDGNRLFTFSYDDQNRLTEIDNSFNIFNLNYNSDGNINNVIRSRSSDNFIIIDFDLEYDNNTNPLNALNIPQEALITLYSFLDLISFDEFLIPLTLSNNNIFFENNEDNILSKSGVFLYLKFIFF